MYGRGKAAWNFRARRSVAVIVVLVVFVITAFGGCSGGDSSTSRASSPEAFAADYRTVTGEFEAEVDRLRTEGQAVLGRGEDALIAFYERLGDATADALERYRALRPPQDLESLQQRIVQLLTEQAEVLDAVVRHARDASPELDRDLQRLGRLLGDWAQANREMTRRLAADTTDTTGTTETTETTSTT